MTDTKSYVEKIEMTIEQAEDIVAHVVKEKLRWENQYHGDDIPSQKLMDALVLVAFHENSEMKDLRESLAKANRQNGAANAREAKLKKENQALKNLLDKLDSYGEKE